MFILYGSIDSLGIKSLSSLNLIIYSLEKKRNEKNERQISFTLGEIIEKAISLSVCLSESLNKKKEENSTIKDVREFSSRYARSFHKQYRISMDHITINVHREKS